MRENIKILKVDKKRNKLLKNDNFLIKGFQYSFGQLSQSEST